MYRLRWVEPRWLGSCERVLSGAYTSSRFSHQARLCREPAYCGAFTRHVTAPTPSLTRITQPRTRVTTLVSLAARLLTERVLNVSTRGPANNVSG